MSIRIVSLYDILHSNVLDWGGLHWGGSSPIFIHHNDFETFTQALEEVVDGSRGYLEPLEFKAFGRDALGRPVPFGEKFLGMCRVNDDEYAYFIIEKRDGRWT